MPKEMENDAIECAKQALQKHSTFGGMATHMKEHFDEKYEKKAKNWSCIVNRIREIGTNIGNVPVALFTSNMANWRSFYTKAR